MPHPTFRAGREPAGACFALRLADPLRSVSSSTSEEIVRPRLLVHFLFPLMLCLLVMIPVSAQTKDQKKSEAQLRTVHGSVVDKGDSAIASSVVYLKNLKSQAVKTYIADDTGHYRFSGLDPNADYEIHAEHGDFTSPTRTISSYDSRRDIEVTLKLSRKKS
jgi:hypothetical protein